MKRNRIRWSAGEKRWGPFTFYTAPANHDRRYEAVLGSGCDEYPGATFRVSLFRRTMIIDLPAIVQPYRERVKAGWDAATVARIGRDYYENVSPREYGFNICSGHLSVMYGRQSPIGNSRSEQQWGRFIPWTQWRFVRHSFYDLDGADVGSVFASNNRDQQRKRWELERELEERTPKRVFQFLDFDGEAITATTHIEEREWRFGEGWFAWLSWFRSPKIVRSLDIRFSKETGERKGSWKGGTVGHSINMHPGELHAGAFARYCHEHDMTLLEPRLEGANV